MNDLGVSTFSVCIWRNKNITEKWKSCGVSKNNTQICWLPSSPFYINQLFLDLLHTQRQTGIPNVPISGISYQTVSDSLQWGGPAELGFLILPHSDGPGPNSLPTAGALQSHALVKWSAAPGCTLCRREQGGNRKKENTAFSWEPHNLPAYQATTVLPACRALAHRTRSQVNLPSLWCIEEKSYLLRGSAHVSPWFRSADVWPQDRKGHWWKGWMSLSLSLNSEAHGLQSLCTRLSFLCLQTLWLTVCVQSEAAEQASG